MMKKNSKKNFSAIYNETLNYRICFQNILWYLKSVIGEKHKRVLQIKYFRNFYYPAKDFIPVVSRIKVIPLIAQRDCSAQGQKIITQDCELVLSILFPNGKQLTKVSQLIRQRSRFNSVVQSLKNDMDKYGVDIEQTVMNFPSSPESKKLQKLCKQIKQQAQFLKKLRPQSKFKEAMSITKYIIFNLDSQSGELVFKKRYQELKKNVNSVLGYFNSNIEQKFVDSFNNKSNSKKGQKKVYELFLNKGNKIPTIS